MICRADVKEIFGSVQMSVMNIGRNRGAHADIQCNDNGLERVLLHPLLNGDKGTKK
jgi:hypothetical protein